MVEQHSYTALLADDVPELRKLLRQVLEWSDRFSVVGEAENGLQAIELAARFKPDLLLLDVSMPIMDGMEALPQILEASPETKVVVLSGFESDRLQPAALAGGAAAYIEKGISPAVLVSQLLGLVTQPARRPPDASARPSAPPPPPANTVLSDMSADEMVSLVAHEIRNPLAVIQGFGMEVQARWDTMSDELKRDAVRRMTERARYVSTLVGNLTFMRKLEAGQLPNSQTCEPIGPLLQSLSEELQELARGHELKVLVPEGLPEVTVDVLRLRQVLTNLVVNAAKFSPVSEPIEITAEHSGGTVTVAVADNGSGIPADKREVVFEKFRRLEEGGAGMGLGLFISRALMRSMHGDLWVADADAGTRMCLSLRADTESLDVAG